MQKLRIRNTLACSLFNARTIHVICFFGQWFTTHRLQQVGKEKCVNVVACSSATARDPFMWRVGSKGGYKVPEPSQVTLHRAHPGESSTASLGRDRFLQGAVCRHCCRVSCLNDYETHFCSRCALPAFQRHSPHTRGSCLAFGGISEGFCRCRIT